MNPTDPTAPVQFPEAHVTGGDHEYEGWLVAIFKKRRGGGVRYVVEDANSRLFADCAGPFRIRTAMNPTDPTAPVQFPEAHVTGGDYEYEGWLVAIFKKRRGGGVRYVVEDANGRLFADCAGPFRIRIGASRLINPAPALTRSLFQRGRPDVHPTGRRISDLIPAPMRGGAKDEDGDDAALRDPPVA